jgi:uridine kinase
MKRSQLLAELAGRIVALDLPHPTRVAIDGVDAAGKTTLANELVDFVEAHGRKVIRASIDGFHNPALTRHRRGAKAPEGYYHDSFNYPALKELLLIPLGPDGTRRYSTAIFDYKTDSELKIEKRIAESGVVLLFDGVFLFRPELAELWDFSIFVEASFEVTLTRAVERDAALFGSSDNVRRRYDERYIPGQKLYLEQCRPKERATVVVDNNDPDNPQLCGAFVPFCG